MSTAHSLSDLAVLLGRGEDTTTPLGREARRAAIAALFAEVDFEAAPEPTSEAAT